MPPTNPIVIPADVKAKIAATQAQQAQADAVGAQAATTALPGPTRDVWSPVPDIEVGPYTVRRFVNGDFLLLDSIGHPLKSFRAMAEKQYDFSPDTPEARQLFWILTRPRSESKAQAANGIDTVKAAAESAFEESTLGQFIELMKAVVKQIEIYASTHLQYEADAKEGDAGPPR